MSNGAIAQYSMSWRRVKQHTMTKLWCLHAIDMRFRRTALVDAHGPKAMVTNTEQLMVAQQFHKL
jgi:hypothetical protein